MGRKEPQPQQNISIGEATVASPSRSVRNPRRRGLMAGGLAVVAAVGLGACSSVGSSATAPFRAESKTSGPATPGTTDNTSPSASPSPSVTSSAAERLSFSGNLYEDHKLNKGDIFRVPAGASNIIAQGDMDVSVDGGKTWIKKPYDSDPKTGLLMLFQGKLGIDQTLTFRAQWGGDVQYNVAQNPGFDFVKGNDLLLMAKDGCEGLKAGGCSSVKVLDLSDALGAKPTGQENYNLGLGIIYEDRQMNPGDIFTLPQSGFAVIQGDVKISVNGGAWKSLYDSDPNSGSIAFFEGALNGEDVRVMAQWGGDVQYKINDSPVFDWNLGNITDLMLNNGCLGLKKGGCDYVNVVDLGDYLPHK